MMDSVPLSPSWNHLQKIWGLGKAERAVGSQDTFPDGEVLCSWGRHLLDWNSPLHCGPSTLNNQQDGGEDDGQHYREEGRRSRGSAGRLSSGGTLCPVPFCWACRTLRSTCAGARNFLLVWEIAYLFTHEEAEAHRLKSSCPVFCLRPCSLKWLWSPWSASSPCCSICRAERQRPDLKTIR